MLFIAFYISSNFGIIIKKKIIWSLEHTKQSEAVVEVKSKNNWFDSCVANLN